MISHHELILWDQKSRDEYAQSYYCIDCQNEIFSDQGTIDGMPPIMWHFQCEQNSAQQTQQSST